MNWLFELHKTQPIAHAGVKCGIVKPRQNVA